MARPGPQTERGKAIVRYNAATHGLTSPAPVVPGLERQEDWEDFVARFRSDFGPVGQLEEVLVEQIASTAWRHRRSVAFETTSLTTARKLARRDAAAALFSRERSASNDASSLGLEDSLNLAREKLDLILAIKSADTERTLTPIEAALLAEGVEDVVNTFYGSKLDIGTFTTAVLDNAGRTF